MRTLVAHPGSGEFAQQSALAFLEAGMLDAFFTTVSLRSDSLGVTLARSLPFAAGKRLSRELFRRRVETIPKNMVSSRPFLEVLRTFSARITPGGRATDKLWDAMSHDFARATRTLMRQKKSEAIYACEYTAKEPFEDASCRGIAKILDLPSLSSHDFEQLLEVESARFSKERTKAETYYRQVFSRRQARRDLEIELADVLVCNSTVTRDSHVKFGADPNKIIVVPLAAPVPLKHLRKRPVHTDLRVIWAGNFSVGKGACYLLEAIEQIKSNALTLEVFGTVALPAASLTGLPSWMNFRGSVPRDQLLHEMETADVLIFPTLSDGFGLVVTEALSRGTPVITTPRAGAADLIQHGVNGLIIAAQSSESIRDAIEWCLDNRERLRTMRSSALSTAKARQWSDYRGDLVLKLGNKLKERGFSPRFERDKALKAGS